MIVPPRREPGGPPRWVRRLAFSATLLALVASRAHLATVETCALLGDAGLRCPRFFTWIDPVLAPLATRPAPAPLDDTHDPLV